MLGRILLPQPGRLLLVYWHDWLPHRRAYRVILDRQRQDAVEACAQAATYWHDRLPHRRAYRVILDRQRQDAVEACAQAATYAYSLEHLLHVRQERESLAVFH
jgi:hypothetical protein